MAIKKTILGNVIGPKGDPGPQGPQGVQGLQGEQGIKGNDGVNGQRGTRWTVGTDISGTSTIPTIFSNSGIDDALVGDQYLNPEFGCLYICVTAGDANTAQWTFNGYLIKDINIINDNWNRKTVDVINVCKKIAYGNGVYVAVGGGRAYYSTDFKNWTSVQILSNQTKVTFNTISFGNGMFIVGGINELPDTPEDFLYYSTDGINWKKGWNSTQYGGVDHVIYGGSTLWMFANDMAFKGPNATEQYDQFMFANASSGQRVVSAAAKDEHTLVIITNTGNGYYIDDLQEEGSKVTPIVVSNAYSVVYGNSKFVCVGKDGYVYSSSDGLDPWRRIQLSETGDIDNIVFANGEFIAVNGTTGEYYKSVDGANWTIYNGGIRADSISDIIFSDNKIVAVVDGLPNHYLYTLGINKTLEEIIIELYTKLLLN